MATGFTDDDDFDWEAAVAEIDKACEQVQKPHASSSHAAVPGDQHAPHGRPSQIFSSQNPQSKANRQQTLDNFLRPPQEDGQHRRNTTVQFVSNLGVDDLLIDSATATSWIYPANVSRREYQFDITKTALFANTIVSLPTGLGKTLIAAVVMYNFFRWFPEGKIVFTAPSRPLVLQQIEACHNIMGIPQVMAIDMTGQMSPSARAEYWKSRRVFFVTPQVLEKDIQSGTCPKHQIVCLVVDEAHRACGNYSYCVVVRELMAADTRLRILALTATPGSNQATIQAVVDNLQISCLEYRSDDDPDVRQYIHNRKLELIQVVMNKECNQVRDRFLEVVQPVVNRLVSLQVFYSRDYARITPFEFLTARERFRQAPPSSLQSSRYGEVEAFFGAAITLYHIFKLLFSHGIRPALEMLQQKMEQPGPFLRMMGKNEKMLQIKQIMQQSVHHGAPSPKLEKLEQILVEHFNVHDPGKTRVIVFTNFRESVKDIMSALARMQGIVRAMEFVGQSGKSSKGQTQKVQLAVLQKFRDGRFNTLVATCIAEEGLDIMEVDLVVCFDANVSPLRMIQRMGRTGRKRDGRVVVLASEGTELQGYLAKQAKSKALGKHMHNGGVQSFNFHPSPRMIPHRFKPEVQLVEMAIEQFVHRGYKQKVDAAIEDPGAAELTAEEGALLLKYSSALNPWTPSLIAFPRFQLVPTPIYQVKHSFRTTSMLIDTFQSLRGAPDHENNRTSTLIDEDEVADSLPDEELREWADELQDLPDADVNIMELAGCWQLEDTCTSLPELKDELMKQSPELEDAKIQSYRGESPVVEVCMTTDLPQLKDELVKMSPELKDAEVQSNRDESPVVEVCMTTSDRKEEKKVPNLVHLYQNDIGSPENFQTKGPTGFSCATTENVSSQALCDATAVNDATASKARIHRCLFSEGVVSVSLTGQVFIAPPPRLEDNKASETYGAKKVTQVLRAVDGSPGLDNDQQTSTLVTSKQQIVQFASDKSFEDDDCKLDVIVPSSLKKSMVVEIQRKAIQAEYESARIVQQLICNSPSQLPSGDSTKLPGSSVSWRKQPWDEQGVKVVSGQGSSGAMGTPLQAAGAFQGRRLNSGSQYGMHQQALSKSSSLRLQGFPEDFSPRLTSLAERGMVPVSPMLEMQNGGSPSLGNVMTPPRYMLKQNPLNLSQGLHQQSITGDKSGGREGFHGPYKVIAKSKGLHLESSVQAQPFGGFLSPIQPKTLEFQCADQGFRTATVVSPSLKQTSNGSMDWQVHSTVPATVERPRKFKRLIKVRDVRPSTEDLSIQKQAEKERTDTKPSESRGGHKGRERQRTARPFVDEEAEVSSSEECSSDEDEFEGDGGDGLEESFIDDGSNPSSATQHPLVGSVDMMAVYRRSLLTPSPAQGPTAPWMRFARANTTPSTDGTLASSSLQTGNSSAAHNISQAECAEEGQPPGLVVETPTFHAISMARIQSSCRKATSGFEARASCVKAPMGSAGEEESKRARLELRKRKLSFQANLLHQETEEVPISSAGMDLVQQGQYSRLEEQCAYLEDDIFEGIDLDALEAEAVEISRARLATQQQTSGTGTVMQSKSADGCNGAGESHPWQ